MKPLVAFEFLDTKWCLVLRHDDYSDPYIVPVVDVLDWVAEELPDLIETFAASVPGRIERKRREAEMAKQKRLARIDELETELLQLKGDDTSKKD